MAFFRTRLLMLFYRELAQLTGAGVPIIEAVETLHKYGGHPGFNRVIGLIKRELAAGTSLGEAFALFPDVFPVLHANIIKYSEASGRLVQGITGLADYLEKEYAMQQSLIVGLAYPVILLHAAMFLFPIINAVGCKRGGYIGGFLEIFIPVYGGIFSIYLIFSMRGSEGFKTGLDNFILAIPKIGNIARQFALARFIRALQALSASGVSILSGWKMAGDSCGNNAVRNAILAGLPLLQSGQSLSQAFIHTRIFPSSIISLIATAEKSGNIVQVLNTIANYAEKENDTAIAVLTSIIPVLVYLLIAGFIALRIVSFYTGYFNSIFTLVG